MKVWIGYACYYNGCDEFVTAEKVFDCEEKAFCWVEELDSEDPGDSRRYAEFEVE